MKIIEKRNNVLTSFRGMVYNNTIEAAIVFSAYLHAGVKDRGGVPYICHAQWIANKVLENNHGIETAIVAYLHDTVEDTCVTLNELREWFSENICDAIDLLTFKDGMDRDEYIRNIAKNQIARTVKKYDLTHNMDIKRLKNRNNLTEKDLARMAKYVREYDFLVGGAHNV